MKLKSEHPKFREERANTKDKPLAPYHSMRSVFSISFARDKRNQKSHLSSKNFKV